MAPKMKSTQRKDNPNNEDNAKIKDNPKNEEDSKKEDDP